MNNQELKELTQSIQRKVGADPDGAWGGETATKTAAALGLTVPSSPPKSASGICPFALQDPIAGGRTMVPTHIVIHDTSGASGQSSIDSWKARGDGVCAHFVVDRDGTIHQCRAANLTAGHTGTDPWKDPTDGRTYLGLNLQSVGIEFANADTDPAANRWAAKQPGYGTIQARHPNGGPIQTWEEYYPAQIEAGIKLINWLRGQFPSIRSMVGHETISPNRRNDPGPAFPWNKVRKATGFQA